MRRIREIMLLNEGNEMSANVIQGQSIADKCEACERHSDVGDIIDSTNRWWYNGSTPLGSSRMLKSQNR